MKNYEQLKQIIQAANPDKSWEFVCDSYPDGLHKCGESYPEPIRLADVLLALGEKYAFDGTGILLERAFGTDDYNMAGMPGIWNLKDDNLDHQSDECKQFLIDLLVK